MQDLTDDRDASAPVLGDIPVLGNLFKHKKQRSVKSELVILLKPVVVNSSEEWSGTLEKTGSDIRRLRDQMNEPPKTFLNELFKPVEEPAN